MKEDFLTEEMRELAGKIAPPMKQIQAETGVSRTTIFQVLRGNSNNQSVVKYLKSHLTKEAEKIKSISSEILKNAS